MNENMTYVKEIRILQNKWTIITGAFRPTLSFVTFRISICIWRFGQTRTCRDLSKRKPQSPDQVVNLPLLFKLNKKHYKCLQMYEVIQSSALALPLSVEQPQL